MLIWGRVAIMTMIKVKAVAIRMIATMVRIIIMMIRMMMTKKPTFWFQSPA